MRSLSARLPSIPIRYAIPGLLALVILAAVGLTGWLAYRSGQRAVDDLATRLGQEATLRIEEHVQAFLNIPLLFHQVNQGSVRAGVLDLDDFDRLQHIFFEQVNVTDSVPYVYYGTKDGYFVGVDKTFVANGETFTVFKVGDPSSITTVVDEETNEETQVIERVTYRLDSDGNRLEEVERRAYDPRTRDWYKAAVEAGGPTWSPIYVFSARPVLGISPVVPIYDPETGELQGVLGIDLTLAELTNFLRSLEISPNGQAFMLVPSGARAGAMVATSTDEEPYTTTADGSQAPLPVLESQNQITRMVAQELERRYGSFDQITDERAFSFKINGDLHFVQVAPIRDERGLNWLAVVTIPAKDFIGPVYDNLRQTALLGLLVLVLAAALGFALARRIIQPILVLSHVAAAIEREKFEVEPLNPLAGRTDELGSLARVFQRMAREVYAREQRLKQQVEQLRVEIDEAKRKEQVSEIVETEFFQELQAKARRLRQGFMQLDQPAATPDSEKPEALAPSEKQD